MKKDLFEFKLMRYFFIIYAIGYIIYTVSKVVLGGA